LQNTLYLMPKSRLHDNGEVLRTNTAFTKFQYRNERITILVPDLHRPHPLAESTRWVEDKFFLASRQGGTVHKNWNRLLKTAHRRVSRPGAAQAVRSLQIQRNLPARLSKVVHVHESQSERFAAICDHLDNYT
jgi:hypothetical protein